MNNNEEELKKNFMDFFLYGRSGLEINPEEKSARNMSQQEIFELMNSKRETIADRAVRMWTEYIDQIDKQKQLLEAKIMTWRCDMTDPEEIKKYDKHFGITALRHGAGKLNDE